MKPALIAVALAALVACPGPKQGPTSPDPTPVTVEPLGDDGGDAVAEPAPPPTGVHGLLSIAGGLHLTPAQRKGTVFLWWHTAERHKAMSEGGFLLQDMVDMFTRLTVLGPVDLTAPDASAKFELPVKSGDVVVSAVLDSSGELFGTLTNRGGDGNLIGQSRPINVPAEGQADGNIELSIIQKVVAWPEGCTGKRKTLVVLDAPEVAGSIQNDTRRRLCVVVPASYAKRKKKRYPVVYVFPGWGGTDAELVTTYPPLVDAASTPERELIAVLVDTSTKAGSSYLVDSPVNGNWDTFLTQRAIPAIDKKFRTIKTRDGRATTGHSTGGFGAVSFGLRHPDLIGIVTGTSPDGLDTGYYFFGDDGGPMLGWILPMLRAEDASGGPGFFASWAADWSPDASVPRGYAWPIDPATGREVTDVANRWRAAGPSSWLADPAKAGELAKQFSGRIFLGVGDADEAGLTAPTQRFSEQLTRAGIEHTLVIQPGGHMNVEGLGGAALEFAVEHLAPPAAK